MEELLPDEKIIYEGRLHRIISAVPAVVCLFSLLFMFGMFAAKAYGAAFMLFLIASSSIFSAYVREGFPRLTAAGEFSKRVHIQIGLGSENKS